MKGERKLIDQNGNLAKQKHFIHGPDSDVSRGKPHALVTDQAQLQTKPSGEKCAVPLVQEF